MLRPATMAGPRLDRLPISRFHYRLLALIGAGMALDGFEIYLQGSVLGALVAEKWSTPAMNANFLSATFAGMVIGAWAAGVMGDHYGRRFSYQINLLIFGLAAFAGALAPTMEWLIAARFVMGLGLGAEIVVGYATLSEFVPAKHRGRWGALLSTITNSALFVSAISARFIIPNWGWRWMFVIVGVAALAVWWLRKAMPESPRWLESKGRFAEAEAILAAIERETEGRSLPPLPPALSNAKATASVRTLFSSPLLGRTLTGSIILIALNTALYGLIAWLPTFMVSQGINIVTSLNYTTLMMFGGPVGGLIGYWLADRLGRKACLVIGSIVAIVLAVAYPAIAEPTLLTIVGFALVSVIYAMIAIGWALYVPELFPTELRMRGSGFCNTVGRLMTVVTPQLVPPLFSTFGVGGVIGMVIVLLMLQILVVGLFGVETKAASLEALAPRAA